MKTENLIQLLAEDAHKPVNLRRALLIAITSGAAIAALVFFSIFGFRHDIDQAVGTGRFIFKIVFTLSLLLSAVSLVKSSIQPGGSTEGRWWLLLSPIVLLVLAVAYELSVTSTSVWSEKLVGHNALHCLTMIPFLSIFPAVVLFTAMRQGAPDNPGLAGAVAALVSSGIASTLYASNCFDDSPLFVATWYSIAILVVTSIGYLAGKRFLRW